MSGRAVFYHLTRSGLEETLLMILTRAQVAGWRVLVRGTGPARLEVLDRRLWGGAGDTGFLAHGLQGGDHDADQPILLGIGPLPTGMRGLVLLDGAETSAAESAELQRVWVLFDGADEAQVAGARLLWKDLTEGGMAAQYWTEESGRWAMKVEKAAQAGV